MRIANEIRMFIRSAKKHSIDTIHLQSVVGVDRDGNEVRVEDRIADNRPAVEEQVTTKMQTTRLTEAMAKTLHGREKMIIEKRYGIGEVEEMTQREIADTLNISRSYVSRIEKKALGKLKKDLDD